MKRGTHKIHDFTTGHHGFGIPGKLPVVSHTHAVVEIEKTESRMEIQEVTVYRKSDDCLITRIFRDGDEIKQITSDDYAVRIKTKDPHNCEPNG